MKIQDQVLFSMDNIEMYVAALLQKFPEYYGCLEREEESTSVKAPAILVLDEAHSLFYGKMEEAQRDRLRGFSDRTATSAYSIFKSAFRAFHCFWEYLWPLTITNQGRILSIFQSSVVC